MNEFSCLITHFLILQCLCTLKIITGTPIIVKDTVDFSLANAVRTDVSYILHRRNSSEEVQTTLTEETVSQLQDLDTNLPTKLFIHGWTSSPSSSPWFNLLKEEYFLKETDNVNIIYIDWSKAGNLSFEISAANVKPVGQFIADFLIESGILAENLHIFGHSLGGAVAGFIGKYFYAKNGLKINRITGLDHVGPGFEEVSSDSRLSESDAVFVDSIHTDIDHWGIIRAIGDVDFYANFGKKQPGCPSLDIDDNCSHARSLYYFIETVNQNTRKYARKAKLNERNEIIITGNCDNQTVFGDPTAFSVRGIYYIETNDESPFLNTTDSNGVMRVITHPELLVIATTLLVFCHY